VTFWTGRCTPLEAMLMIGIGKILQDGNTIESYNIEEKGFIVCMVSKVWCYI
jgi:UV excision repair protein RAD23